MYVLVNSYYLLDEHIKNQDKNILEVSPKFALFNSVYN